jgi:hypothetical protein
MQQLRGQIRFHKVESIHMSDFRFRLALFSGFGRCSRDLHLFFINMARGRAGTSRQ